MDLQRDHVKRIHQRTLGHQPSTRALYEQLSRSIVPIFFQSFISGEVSDQTLLFVTTIHDTYDCLHTADFHVKEVRRWRFFVFGHVLHIVQWRRRRLLANGRQQGFWKLHNRRGYQTGFD